MMPELHIANLAKNFTALADKAEKIMFPDKRDGVFARPDKNGWSKLRTWLYIISQPFNFMNPVKLLVRLFLLVCWVICSISTLFLFLRLINYLAIGFDLVRIVFLCFFIFICYWSWIEYFRNPQYSWGTKIGWAVLFFLYCILLTAGNLNFAITFEGNTFKFWLLYFVLTIPAFTLYYMLVFHLIIALGWLLKIALLYIWSYHAPRPINQIKKLVAEKCLTGNESSDANVSLLEIPLDQIHSLREWAEANREGTEKRTVPTFIILALLGLFADTKLFSSIVSMLGDVIIQFVIFFVKFLGINSIILEKSSKSSLLFMIFLPILMPFFYIVIRAFINLFRNLVAQNLIIEACVVAEYAVSQKEKKRQEQESSRLKKSIWNRLLNVFFPFLN